MYVRVHARAWLSRKYNSVSFFRSRACDILKYAEVYTRIVCNIRGLDVFVHTYTRRVNKWKSLGELYEEGLIARWWQKKKEDAQATLVMAFFDVCDIFE